MLLYPIATTRTQKLEMIELLKERLLQSYGNQILAIGAYGSIALESEGPFSDIELHVITKDTQLIESFEFVYGKFKIEIASIEKSLFFAKAKKLDDSWAIKAGAYINILPIYDPDDVFGQVQHFPMEISDTAIKELMKEFMVWEPYETIAKIRTNYHNGNLAYLTLGAHDLLWQTAKLIGLANKCYYSTRARMFEESLEMQSLPSGYKELLNLFVDGKLEDKEQVYHLCENLWTGLNQWYEKMGLDYRLTNFPF